MAGLRALCGRSAGVQSPGGTAEPLQMAAVTSLHQGHAVGSEHGSVPCDLLIP